MGLKGGLGLLFLAFVLILMTFYYLAPYNDLEFSLGSQNSNFSAGPSGLIANNMQFYQNMRYPSKEISFNIAEKCSIKKNLDARDAIEILGNKTSLSFYPDPFNSNINITCDETTRFENGVFVAGEGGPTRIVKSGNFNVITEGMVLLIRDSKCSTPNVAIHEILHALGFTHSENPGNIMYNFTSCDQEIGEDTIELIDNLYSIESLPDLVFEELEASLEGRYLDIAVSVRNIGLADSESSLILVKGNGKLIKEIKLKGLDLGAGVAVEINNLFVKSISLDSVSFEIVTEFDELDKENNLVELEVSS